MRCPYCKETIDDDSLFCDRCGQELKFCPECKAPKRGTDCPMCGTTLVSGKVFFMTGKSTDAQKAREDTGVQQISDPEIITQQLESQDAMQSQDNQPLHLVGEGMKLEMKEGSFGRKGGIYPEFASCIFVSGRHGEFSRTPCGWTVTDLGSTNGTYLNGERLKTGNPYPLKRGDTIKISRLSFTIQ